MFTPSTRSMIALTHVSLCQHLRVLLTIGLAFLGSIVIVAVVMPMNPGSLVGALASMPATLAAIAMAIVSLLVWNPGCDLTGQGEGHSSWLFRQPVPTGAMTVCVVASRIVWMAFAWTVIWCLNRQLILTGFIDTRWPFWASIASLSAGSLWMTAAIRYPFRYHHQQIVALLAALILAVGGFVVAMLPIEAELIIGSGFRLATTGSSLIVSTLGLHTAMVAARSRQRSSVLPPFLVKVLETLARGNEVSTNQTSTGRSAVAMFSWFPMMTLRWQQHRLWRRIFMFVVLPPSVAILGWYASPSSTSVVFTAVLTFVAAATLMGSVDQSSQSSPHRMDALRRLSPWSTASLAWADLVAKCVVGLPVLLLPIFVIAVWSIDPNDRELGRRMIDQAGGPARCLAIAIAITAFVLGRFVAMQSIESSGRTRISASLIVGVYATIMVGLGVASLQFGRFESWEDFDRFAQASLQWTVPIAAAALLAKAIAVVVAIRVCLQRKLFDAATAIKVVLIWAAICAALAATTLPLADSRYIGPLAAALLVMLAVPLARWLAMPAMVDMDRHR